jgi:transcriptional regulator with XRE-family HTH domain
VHDFAKRLRRLREARGLTKYRLAQLSGVSKEGVSKLEAPGSNPRVSTLLKLARGLNVNPVELVPRLSKGGATRKK